MTSYVYSSVLRDYIEGVIRQKRSLGFSYDTEARILLKFDRFCTAEGCTQPRLDRTLVEAWNAKRPNESPATRMGRISALRQLALYMVQMDLPAYVTPTRHHPKVPRYVPYIFSATELGALFAQIDSCTYCCEVPYRQRVMPLLFRLLYGCGLRLSEALCLHLADVDLETGVLTIRDAKFHKDRLVPMTEELLERCLDYAQLVHRNSEPEALFFVGRPGHPLSGGNVYKNFRRFLWQAGISHGGWGKGPRVHDFRHTFAVHCLARWVREGKDLAVYLPILKTYLGHYSFRDTAYYLRLIAELYPDITARMEQSFGHVFPEVEVAPNEAD
ncbi:MULTISPECIES: tyrosine-type recombinase/integrase [Ferrimicrobium]|uniref:tyrosine-type recombinase/integrase n=1 Tax=Ferrimicrobium TaxID=121038 RepID=UPI0023F3382E|nr:MULTISPECIES: tyrosine-type recombinase/integrase [Ferrimicrobium]